MIGLCSHAGSLQALDQLRSGLSCVRCRSAADIWFCLTCARVGCGRNTSCKQAEAHFMKDHHSIALKLSGDMIWCYKCEDQLIDQTQRSEQADQQSSQYEKLSTFIKQVKETFFQKIYSAKKDSSSFELALPVNVPNVFGLHNIGNTCFFNSIMQCINATYQLCDVYMSKQIDLLSGKTISPFKKAVKDLICDDQQVQEQWISANKKQTTSKMRIKDIKVLNKAFREFCIDSKRSKTYDPSNLFKAIASFKTTFASMAQQDSQQLLRFFLQGLAEGEDELLRVNKKFQKKYGKHQNNFTQNIFGGYLASHLLCRKCKYESWTFDFIMDLSLEICKKPIKVQFPDAFNVQAKGPYISGQLRTSGKPPMPKEWPSIQSCLYTFFSPETLTKANYFICQKCKDKFSEGVRKFYLYKPPPILTINIKRFRGVGSKDTSYVDFQENLEVFHIIGTSNKPVKYKLYGISVHQGSYGGGHYVAYVKHGEKWFYFSDSSVRQMKEQSVFTGQAYVLFYRRVN